VVNVKTAVAELETFMRDGGYFDTAIEVSGNIRGLENCIDATHPGGRIVQVGIMPAGNAGAPINISLVADRIFVVLAAIPARFWSLNGATIA
jgi:L-idonate 5-dehydrogenase